MCPPPYWQTCNCDPMHAPARLAPVGDMGEGGGGGAPNKDSVGFVYVSYKEFHSLMMMQTVTVGRGWMQFCCSKWGGGGACNGCGGVSQLGWACTSMKGHLVAVSVSNM